MRMFVKNSVCKVANYIKKNKIDLVKMGLMVAIVAVPEFTNVAIGEAAQTNLNADLPWNKGVTTLTDELTGPLPRIAGVIAVAVAGVMMAFSEMSGMTKKAIQIVFGLGIAISAAQLVAALTGKTDVVGLVF